MKPKREHVIYGALVAVAVVGHWFGLPLLAAAAWSGFGLYAMRHIFTESD